VARDDYRASGGALIAWLPDSATTITVSANSGDGDDLTDQKVTHGDACVAAQRARDAR
jgi:hypothetical protein